MNLFLAWFLTFQTFLLAAACCQYLATFYMIIKIFITKNHQSRKIWMSSCFSLAAGKKLLIGQFRLDKFDVRILFQLFTATLPGCFSVTSRIVFFYQGWFFPLYCKQNKTQQKVPPKFEILSILEWNLYKEGQPFN